MNKILYLILSLAAICCPASADLGITFDKRADSLPVLKLPYASYRAASYDPNGDVCTSLPSLSHHPQLY